MADHPKTNGGRLLKRGDRFDPECYRTSYRLSKGQALLAAAGVTLEWEHGPGTGLVGTGLMTRTGHVCDYRCKAVWPEWVTGATFDMAYRLADAVQTARGDYHKAEAYRLRAERERTG